MNDTERIKARLASLAAPPTQPPQARRLLSPPGRAGLLGAVLREIDETVLPRQIRFVTDRGSFFVLELANRRLFRLREMGGSTLPGGRGGPVDQPLSETDRPALEALGELLRAALAGAERLWVAESTPADDLDLAALGCASEALARLWQLDLEPRRGAIDSDLLDRFVAECAALSRGAIVIDTAGVAQKHGDADTLARLDALASRRQAELRGRLDRCFPGSRHPAYLTTVDDGAGPEALFFGAGAGAQMFLSAPAAHRRQIMDIWKRLTA